jgi:hypothetical protein
MDLNAYVLAMAIAGASRQLKTRPTVPKTAFRRLDLRYFSGLPVNATQLRHIWSPAKAQNNLSEALTHS